MQPIIDYLDKGGPVAGLRTTTHGFNGLKGKNSKYNYNSRNPEYDWGSAVRSSGKLGDPRKGRGIMAKTISTAPVCSWFPGKKITP